MLWSALLILVAPPALFAAMLALQLTPHTRGLAVTSIEIGLALVPGVVGIRLLSLRLGHTLLLLLVYVPAMIFALSLWGLLFMCGAFGACL